ncbi:MAG: DUF1460 domain-containing protein [Deltaproteobacteria bacterium]|nr:MAG: DUF1460 domain-containing protein [Deltaproteobacteria bacterium]
MRPSIKGREVCMLLKILPVMIVLVSLVCTPARAASSASLVNLGRWSFTNLDRLIVKSRNVVGSGERLVILSRPFLGTPYMAHSLVGGPETDERLVLDLAGLDCFTFLDLLEALRRCDAAADLLDQLRQVRYRQGRVSYENRRHFFSDWIADDDPVAVDVTSEVGRNRHRTVVKNLNRKADGSQWLEGLPVVQRAIRYLPTGALDATVLASLRPGDFIGIYSEKDGLDVSHVGLLVPAAGGSWALRHASSRPGVMQVTDDELTAYLRGKPGIVIYRAR